MAPRRRKILEAEFHRLSNAAQADFITLEAFYTSTEVAELLREKLLAKAEVEAFWMGEVGAKDDSADVDGFLAVHGKIDALFEEDDDENDDEEPALDDIVGSGSTSASAPSTPKPSSGGMTVDEFMASGDVARYLEDDLVTKEEVLDFWRDEAGAMVADGPTVPTLSRDASMRVYARIEELLEDDDGDDEVSLSSEASLSSVPAMPPATPVDELMAEYAAATGGAKNKMDYATFLKTNDLPDLLADGLVTKDEVKGIWATVTKGGDVAAVVDFAGFQALSNAIDDLFMEEEEEKARKEAEEKARVAAKDAMTAAFAAVEPLPSGPEVTGPAKPQLLEILDSVKFAGLLDEENKELDEFVGALAEALIDDEANLATRDDLEIVDLQKLIEGEWDLAYSTSRTMRYNRGLSGLGKSLPKAEFLGFRQSIVVNGYALETVYTEKLRTLGQDLDVIVEAAWELKDVVSMMDGEVELIMDVLPAQIKYGFMTERIETGWKGVRVLNRCELLYLDQNIRIMKGQSSDSYFVFRRFGGGGAK